MTRNFTPCLAHGNIFCEACWPQVMKPQVMKPQVMKPKYEDHTGHVTPSLDLPEIRKTISETPAWLNLPARDAPIKSNAQILKEAYVRIDAANLPCPICHGIEGCDHTRLERERAKILAEPHKQIPLFSGCIAYFFDALMEVAELSRLANDKHNPGLPLQWTKGHSNKHLDSAARHLGKAGTLDPEWAPAKIRHSTELAWRALANLQIEIENERNGGSSVR